VSDADIQRHRASDARADRRDDRQEARRQWRRLQRLPLDAPPLERHELAHAREQ
jgi:hypothetical protein